MFRGIPTGPFRADLSRFERCPAALRQTPVDPSLPGRRFASQICREGPTTLPAGLPSGRSCLLWPMATRTGPSQAACRTGRHLAHPTRCAAGYCAAMSERRIILIRSPRRPRKTNRCPANGSCFRVCSAWAANVVNPRRMSVARQCMFTCMRGGHASGQPDARVNRNRDHAERPRIRRANASGS